MTYLFVGCGHLGIRICDRLKTEGNCAIAVITRTPKQHAELLARGISVFLSGSFGELAEPRDFGVWIAPPSAWADLKETAPQIIKQAKRWLLISSTGVYDGMTGEINEATTLPKNLTARARHLFEIEQAFEHAHILRLAGLYHLSRGPHQHYLKTYTSDQDGQAPIHLIHYDDAADLAVRILNLPPSVGQRLWIGCDDQAITREALAQAAFERAEALGVPEWLLCKFTGAPQVHQRSIKNPLTRRLLFWNPSYPSFLEWIKTL